MVHRHSWNFELCLQYIYSEIGYVTYACYRGAKKEIPELTMCGADCDKGFCGPQMFVCRVLCWSRAQFHIAERHFCLDFLFFTWQIHERTQPLLISRVGGWVGKGRLSGMLVPCPGRAFPQRNATGCAVLVAKQHLGEGCAPLGNCPSLLFAGVCSLASYCNCRYSHMAEKHLLLFFVSCKQLCLCVIFPCVVPCCSVAFT